MHMSNGKLSDKEAVVAEALAKSMHAKRRRNRVFELSLSAVGVIFLLMRVGGLLTLGGDAFDPLPLRWFLVAQIGLPWISFAVTWYCLDRDQGGHGRYVSLVFASLLTSLVAGVPYGFMSLVSRTPTVLWACVVGLAIFIVLNVRQLADWKVNRVLAVTLAGSLMFYSYVALVQLNCLLDRSPAMLYKSVVVGKGREYLGPYTLHIQPWNGVGDVAIVGVPRKLDSSVEPGDTICVLQRKGAFQMAWFTAQRCPSVP
jgi:hypothetical protein